MSDISVLSAGGNPSADRATLNANFQYVQENFRSNTAPASPRAGQTWIDSSGAVDIWKIRNRANSAWVAIFADLSAVGGGLLPLTGGTMSGAIAMGSNKITGLADGTASGDAVHKGQVDARVHMAAIPLGTINATDNKYIGIIGPGTWTIVDVLIVSELGVTSDASHYWTFQVRNVTAAVDLRTSVKSTNGAAITADAAYALGLDQNLTPSSGAIFQLQMTKTGSPNALTDAVAIIRYTIAT